MVRRNIFCWLLVVMMFCVIASGGCGGSSSGSVAKDNKDQEQDTTPNNPHQQTTAYDLSIMAGSWTASNGTGTATGYDGTFDLRMVHVNASFSSVKVSGSTATAIASTSSEWEAYKNGAYTTSIYNDYEHETISIQNIGGNRWRYTFPDSTSTITVTITSSTTAEVYEEGTTSDGYRYSGNYTMTKDDPSSQETYDFSAFQGTWTISRGRGSATGNGGNYDLVPSSLGTLTIHSLQENGDTLTGSMTGTLYWNVYQNGTQVLRAGLEYSRLEAQRISGNTWRSTTGNSDLTLTSQTTASVHEKGIFRAYGLSYQYDIVYTLTKQ